MSSRSLDEPFFFSCCVTKRLFSSLFCFTMYLLNSVFTLALVLCTQTHTQNTHQLFQVSHTWLAMGQISTCFKASLTGPQDYRPVVLTFVAIKVTEHLVLSHLRTIVDPVLDLKQFAYKANQSTEGVVNIALDYMLKHLDTASNYVPLWTCTPTGPSSCPWGCVLSPKLFFSVHQLYILSTGRSSSLHLWTSLHPGVRSNRCRVELNAQKTVKLVVDFRWKAAPPSSQHIRRKPGSVCGITPGSDLQLRSKVEVELCRAPKDGPTKDVFSLAAAKVQAAGDHDGLGSPGRH